MNGSTFLKKRGAFFMCNMNKMFFGFLFFANMKQHQTEKIYQTTNC